MKKILNKYDFDTFGQLILYILGIGLLSRWFKLFYHKYGWHHTVTIYPDGDKQIWCQWCGLRETYKSNPLNQQTLNRKEV